MIAQEQIDRISELAKTDTDVAAMLKEYTVLAGSPYVDSYMTLYNHITEWNRQLAITKEMKQSAGKQAKEITKGKIDLLSNKDSESFEKAFKYFKSLMELHEALDTIRSKMTPDQQKEVESKKTQKNTSVAI